MKAESLQQLIDWKPPTIQYIIQDILPIQSRMILYGKWKTWKSMTAMHTGFVVTSNKPWFGFKTFPHRTLIFQSEISKALFRKRVMKYAEGNDCYPKELYFTSDPYIKFDRGFGFSQMEAVLSILRPKLLIIDPIYKILSGDISSSVDVQRLLDNFELWIKNYELSIILITHTRKPVVTSEGIVERGEEELMGSSYFANWADSIVGLRKRGTDGFTLSFTSLRHAEEEINPIKVQIERETLQFRVVR